MVLSSAKYKRHSNESGGDLAEDRQNVAEIMPSTSANSSIIISGNNLVTIKTILLIFFIALDLIQDLADFLAVLLRRVVVCLGIDVDTVLWTNLSLCCVIV